jgi:putative transposase
LTSPPPLRYNTYYHIYNRGVNRWNIFIEERNYEYFLKLYKKHIVPVVETYAYCLLKNHFHLAIRVKAQDEILEILETLRVLGRNGKHLGQVESKKQNSDSSRKPLGSDYYVSTQFSNFFNAYAKGINKAYDRTGSLFQHPFGRVMITSDRQFWRVIKYIHQNPQKHGFVDDFREWRYSSYELLLGDKPTFLRQEAVLDWFGVKEEYSSLHTEWVNEQFRR